MNPNIFADLEGYDSDGVVISPRIERVSIKDVPELPKNAEELIRPAMNTTARLINAGMKVQITASEEAAARSIFTKENLITRQDVQSPEIILKLSALLNEYDHQVVKDADQIRRYATNKLLELSDSKNPSTQLKAIELLGKISDVALFAERSIVTVEHQSTDELQAKLKKTIEILLDPEDYKTIETTNQRNANATQ